MAHGRKCLGCGFNETPTLLDVHHKDRNQANNDPTNLQVLCVMCHAKVTRLGAYF